MSRNVLIAGSSILLGSYLAALRLIASEDTVVFYAAQGAEELSREELAAHARHAARLVARGGDAEAAEKSVESRLRLLPGDPLQEGSGPPVTLPAEVRAVEVWYLSTGAGPTHRRGAQADAVRSLISALPGLHATEFNYVDMACVTGAVGGGVRDEPRSPRGEDDDALAVTRRAVEREVVERCDALGIGRRIFRTALVVGEVPPVPRFEGEGFLQFLSALHSVKSEAEERFPEYFEYQALRFRAPAGASLNLIRVEHAAELMLRIAQRPDTRGRCYHIMSPESVPLEGLCERIGAAYEISLLPAGPREELNAIDQLFQERLGGPQAFPASPDGPCGEAYSAADFAPELALLDEETQLSLLRAVRRGQDAARAARLERVAAAAASLERRVIDRGGFGLTYYAAGSGGPPVVLLNALGQSADYWHRLVERLMRRHRVITWEPRGLDHAPRPFLLGDHVDDLEAILKEEAADSFHLVGWCTGPKVALEFYRRRPEAAESMVFLNSSFKQIGSSPELDTAYGRNLETLCRALDRRPEMATSVCEALRSRVTGDGPDPLDGTDPARFAADVLSTMNRDLRGHVLAPFRSEKVLCDYARQLLDFWAYDALAAAGEVRAPVLLVSAEYDKIAPPDIPDTVVERFPAARHVRVQGASHYCLYDRPDLIANLMETFFRNPDGLDELGGEVRLAHRVGRGRPDSRGAGDAG